MVAQWIFQVFLVDSVELDSNDLDSDSDEIQSYSPESNTEILEI